MLVQGASPTARAVGYIADIEKRWSQSDASDEIALIAHARVNRRMRVSTGSIATSRPFARSAFVDHVRKTLGTETCSRSALNVAREGQGGIRSLIGVARCRI